MSLDSPRQATFVILVGILKAIPAAMGFEEIIFLNRLAVPLSYS
jgi:hypothetical protein